MSPKQGWFESDDDYRARVAKEADEGTIESASGSAPSQGWLESDDSYRERIAREANEHRIESATGSAPSRGWFESDESYHDRIAREANEHTVENATGYTPTRGWFESDDAYDVRIRKEANEQIVARNTGYAPRQGWFESNYAYRSRIAHEAREIRASSAAGSSEYSESGASDSYGSAERASRPKDRLSGSPLGKALGAAVVLAVVAALLSAQERRSPSTIDGAGREAAPSDLVGPGQAGPTLPFEDHGACPGEGCAYGDWIAQEEVVVYRDRAPGSPIAFRLPPHTRVKALTGVVVTSKAGSATTQRAVSIDGKSVPPGVRVAVLTYGGEGCYKIWVPGKSSRMPATDSSAPPKRSYVCDLADVVPPESTWWAKIQSRDGRVGWSNELASFGQNDRRLVETILDASIPLKAKVAHIDEMLEAGAELNGPFGKYVDSPAGAAIETGDLALIRALLDRGLDLNRRDQCLAYAAFQRLLNPNGIELAELLLDHGLRTDCVEEPFANLRSGCATGKYDVNAAIRAARFLVAQGFDPSAKDRNGKSFMDRTRNERFEACRRRLEPVVAVLQEATVARSRSRAR